MGYHVRFNRVASATMSGLIMLSSWNQFPIVTHVIAHNSNISNSANMNQTELNIVLKGSKSLTLQNCISYYCMWLSRNTSHLANRVTSLFFRLSFYMSLTTPIVNHICYCRGNQFSQLQIYHVAMATYVQVKMNLPLAFCCGEDMLRLPFAAYNC